MEQSLIYDLLAVGLGPAALSVGIALLETNSRIKNGVAQQFQPTFSSLGGLQEALTSTDSFLPSVSSPHSEPSASSKESDSAAKPNEKELSFCSIELHKEFKWHPGMLLDGSRMQISFLKDLVTLRNPTSSYSFINYLHSLSPSRLLSFISIAQFAPSRREFADYLSWCAKTMEAELVETGFGECGFGEVVLRIDAVLEEDVGEVGVVEVTSRVLATGVIRRRRARNLLLSTGGKGKLPRDLEPIALKSTRVIHSSQYLDKIDSILDHVTSSRISSTKLGTIKLAVIGAGQSAAEIFLNLRSTLASHLALNRFTNFDESNRPEIHIFIRRGALRQASDCAFSNEVFDPGMSQSVFQLDEGGRRTLMEEARNTNYSVVNPDTLTAIYEVMYSQKVEEDISLSSPSTKHFSDPKLIIHPYSDLTFASLNSEDGRIKLLTTNSITQSGQKFLFDAVFCGTGYNRQGWKDVLFPPPKESRSTILDSNNQVISTRNISLGELFQHDEPQALLPLHASTIDNPSLISSAANSTDPSTSNPSRPLTPTSSESMTSSSSSPNRSSSELDMKLSTPSSSILQLDLVNSASGQENSQKLKSRAVDYKIQQNYRLVLPTTYSRSQEEGESTKELGKFRPTVWVQGSNEATHGISDSLLSVLAVRSGEVVKALRKEGWFGEI